MEVGEASSATGWDTQLPPRLFATDRFPMKRLNVYSRMETLLVVRDLLKGTPEWDVIKGSCFGKLFDLPIERCSISCKLIHALLTRTLVSRKKYVIWSVYGGQPFRFAIKDFEAVTGLPCGEFPEEYDVEEQIANKDIPDAYWSRLIGLSRSATLSDIVDMMRGETTISGWRRVRLALLLIVDGVLVASAQHSKPTPKYVKLTENVHEFLEFPWGRECFLWTISSMKPGKKVAGKNDDPVGAFCQQLKQESLRLVGFPLALQLVAFAAIPSLLAKLQPCKQADRLVDYPGNKLPPTALSAMDVHDAERVDDLAVVPMVGEGLRDEEWDDEIRDKRVTYLEDKIASGHRFTKGEWPGGDASIPLNVPSLKENLGEKRKARTRSASSAKKARTDDGGSDGVGVDSAAELERKVDLLSVRVDELLVRLDQVEQVKETMDQVMIEMKKLSRRLAERELRRKMVDAGGIPKKRVTVCQLRGHKTKGGYGGVEVDEVNQVRNEPMVEQINCPAETGGAAERRVPQESRLSTERASRLSTEDACGVSKQRVTAVPRDDRDGVEAVDHGDNVHLGADKTHQVGQGVGAQTHADTATERETVLLSNPVDEQVDGSRAEMNVDHISGEQVDDHGAEKCVLQGTDCLNENLPAVESEKVVPGSDPVLTAELVVSGVENLTTSVVGDLPEEGILSGGDEDVQPTPAFPLTQDIRGQAVDETVRADHDCMVDEYRNEGMASVSAVARAVMEEHGAPTNVKSDVSAGLVGNVDDQCDSTDEVDGSDSEHVEDNNSEGEEMGGAGYVLSAAEKELRDVLCRDFSAGYVIMPEVEHPVYPLFSKTLATRSKVRHATAAGYELDNNFFLVLGGSQQWITTLHMEVLMTYIGARHRRLFRQQRLCFASPWLTMNIQGKYRAFSKAYNKDKVAVDDKIRRYVHAAGERWIEDVDTVYVPMVWAASHWVGLCINLAKWSVDVLDPYPDKPEEEVTEFMKPVLDMLPYIVRLLCPGNLSQTYGERPFCWSRVRGLYSNERRGDCGPVAAKFMEVHALGEQALVMEGMKDESVDKFRKEYAVDVYKDWVLPLYPQEGSEE